MKSSKKQKVLLALSGGVDSSVAALLLKKQGYEVIGAFMKNWSDTKDPLTGQCAWRSERKMAIKIASHLDIPLITLDFEKIYKKDVIEKMFEKYKKGITPNPDIDCNQKIKFPLLLKHAKKIGINFIATGHYARVKKNTIKNKYELLRGKDESKDQSYFLYRMKNSELQHTIFPIGNYTKKEIREIAEKNHFPNYNKKGTVGICFIGKIDFKEFLRKKIKPKKGNILNPEGKIIGEHDGVFYYTIGERLGSRHGQGFELDRGDKTKPSKWYVAKKDIKKNILIAAPRDHPLNFRKEINIKKFYLISDSKEKLKNKKTNVFSRIRHVGELLPSKLFYEKGKWKINLKEPITGISEGQAIVLYEGEKCIGGGEISFYKFNS
jgi:tRNA-specific 2-thiouridylase